MKATLLKLILLDEDLQKACVDFFFPVYPNITFINLNLGGHDANLGLT